MFLRSRELLFENHKCLPANTVKTSTVFRSTESSVENGLEVQILHCRCSCLVETMLLVRKQNAASCSHAFHHIHSCICTSVAPNSAWRLELLLPFLTFPFTVSANAERRFTTFVASLSLQAPISTIVDLEASALHDHFLRHVMLT